jgi:hypothetical protein
MDTEPAAATSPDIARRRRGLESTLGSLRIEGLEVDAQTRATLERFVAGEITSDEMMEAILAAEA